MSKRLGRAGDQKKSDDERLAKEVVELAEQGSQETAVVSARVRRAARRGAGLGGLTAKARACFACDVPRSKDQTGSICPRRERRAPRPRNKSCAFFGEPPPGFLI